MRPWTLGIDLGTTNSTAAVFDGETIETVRTASGSPLLPSVVRITKQGTVVVGEKARRYLDKDPENTRGGFKRLLGTSTSLAFPAAGLTRTPGELSAEVLKALLEGVVASGRPMPEAGVVTVPALFELPQTEDTARAARAAGLATVEMLQEPVASALAGGFRADGGGCWMVYDLGGGTFDASLVVGEDGLLSVIGHEGDNYLGGRDFDAALAAMVAEAVASREGVRIDAKRPSHQRAWRTLLALAEDAKIDLSRNERVTVSSEDPIEVDGDEVDVDVVIERAAFEAAVMPLVERSIAVCKRLLDAHGRDALDRIVLVGGPTAMPLVRAKVAEALGPIAAESLDPMTLVAQGAALYAAQRGLWCGAAKTGSAGPRSGAAKKQLVLRAPPVSSDLLPFVVGRVADPSSPPKIERVRLVREASSKPGGEIASWESAWEVVDAEGAFAIGAELIPRRGNVFRVEARGEDGRAIDVEPGTVSILQGVTIGDPPVSRSVGVALANGEVQVYLEKGLPLPARRTFIHRTVDAVIPGQPGSALRIPLVQGEYAEARFCRLIGALEIDGRDVEHALPSGTAVEVTLELDRGGRMTARATIAALKKTFEQIATLVVPEASAEVLAQEAARLLDRLGLVGAQAAAEEHPLVHRLSNELMELERLVERAAGGDGEAAQQARRAALDLDAQISELEARKSWPDLVEDAMDDATWASSWIERHGTDAEQRMLQSALDALDRARRSRVVRDLERQRRSLRRLGWSAFMRNETAFIDLFEHYAARIEEASDLKEAQSLVSRGRKLAAAGENRKLEPIVERLRQLLPFDAQVRRASHASGLR